MERHDAFVLVQWTGDKDFSWRILPREEVFTTDEELSTGMTCKAKWKSSQLDAEVLALDGKTVRLVYVYNFSTVYSTCCSIPVYKYTRM